MSVEFNNLMVSDSANKLEVAELSELIEGKFKFVCKNIYFNFD